MEALMEEAITLPRDVHEGDWMTDFGNGVARIGVDEWLAVPMTGDTQHRRWTRKEQQ